MIRKSSSAGEKYTTSNNDDWETEKGTNTKASGSLNFSNWEKWQA
jgi:hypothetical protein